MRQLVILFVILFGSFLGVWTYKINTPVNRPDEYEEGVSDTAGEWWNQTSINVDEEWELDPEIPLNYIPVPGEDELYMVIDNDGKIIGYRKRTKQIDGSWLWEDVNPDIPENYEAVEGLDDVYKVTYEDGSVQYFKYIRNDDDTFAFVEVDENGNILNKDRDATIIDGKHVHITGNTYAYLDDNGVVIGYDKRVDNGDGTYSWIDTTLPDLNDMSLLYGDSELGSGLASDGSVFDQSLDTSGYSADLGNGTSSYNYDVTINQYSADDLQTGENYGDPSSNLPDAGLDLSDVGSDSTVLSPSEPTIVNNSDGTHTEIETVSETKVIDGWTYTYETYVKKTYDSAGNLISTISEGPYETSSYQNLTTDTTPVQSLTAMADTLSGEVSRVTGSYTYNTSLETEVYTLMNAQRTSKGLPSLNRTTTADSIAQLRAADMAGYDTSSNDLPTYGTLTSMMSYFSISSSDSGENLWKTVERTADEIHTRFQALDSTRETRMDEEVSQYGIAIVEKNGYYYICEVVL